MLAASPCGRCESIVLTAEIRNIINFGYLMLNVIKFNNQLILKQIEHKITY